MFNYTKEEVSKLAKENGFRNETFEKVLRLIDVLNFINTNKILSSYLVLKGGTAINLTIFKLPRLSVDIDLDFSHNGSREDMLIKREEISSILKKYMEINGYFVNNESKFKFALDSFVFSYNNDFGNKDNLKIEINYLNRVHIYEPIVREVSIVFFKSFKVLTLNKYELFGSKIKALIERCTIRDVYDVYHMIEESLFKDNEYELIKKCTIFYLVIGNTSKRNLIEEVEDFHRKIDSFVADRIPQYLSSTLRNNDKFSMKEAAMIVKKFIDKLMILDESEKNFLSSFENKEYRPEMLFHDQSILERIKEHPMAIWKISNA